MARGGGCSRDQIWLQPLQMSVFIEERLEGQGSPSEQNRVSYFLNQLGSVLTRRLHRTE